MHCHNSTTFLPLGENNMRRLLTNVTGITAALGLMLVGALPAGAATTAEPTLSTLPATAITGTSATINGNVADNGLATTTWFQWGTSTSYGNTTPDNTEGLAALSAGLTGLTTGTVYDFRAVAENSKGTVDGANLTFTAGGATPTPTPTATTPTPTPTPTPTNPSGVAYIPVLSYHQLDNGCAKTATLCDPPTSEAGKALAAMDPTQLAGADGIDKVAAATGSSAGTDIDSLSQTQFAAEMTWLKNQGWHTVTAQQYVDWATGVAVTLPSKPILLTVDDGIEDFYADGTSVLQKDGFNILAFIVTQFADGATAGAQPYVGWNATWAQLQALPKATYGFAFHAGAEGHSVVYPNNPGCTYFYPCQLPTETAAQYEARVSGEIDAGRLELSQNLTVDPDLWAVPWNAIGQASQPASGTDPATFLPAFGGSQFKVVFLQDPDPVYGPNERYRLEIHGDMTLAVFESNFLANIADGFFNK
jgi:hypothetical protein